MAPKADDTDLTFFGERVNFGGDSPGTLSSRVAIGVLDARIRRATIGHRVCSEGVSRPVGFVRLFKLAHSTGHSAMPRGRGMRFSGLRRFRNRGVLHDVITLELAQGAQIEAARAIPLGAAM
jgi:hypothetical protein